MISRDISLATPAENLLFDDVLLQLAEEGRSGEVLRFWESSVYFVVLGRIGKLNAEVNVDQVVKDDIPVLRRSSGGGTVLQGPGCLNYTLILSKAKSKDVADLKRSYQYILARVVKSLAAMGFEAEFLPISDIAMRDTRQKISGNAQKRAREYILHHGTILYDFNLHKIERYLKIPADMPAYRENRHHLDFVQNVRLNPDDFKSHLRQTFSVEKQCDALIAEESKKLQELSAVGKTFVAIE